MYETCMSSSCGWGIYENMKSDESTSKTWNDFSLLTDRSDRDPAVQLMDRLKSIIILRSSNVHWNWFYDRLAKYHLVKNSSVKSKDHTEFWLLKLIINWPRFWKTWFGRMTRFFFYEKTFNIKTSLIFCKCLQARNVASGTNYSIYLWCCTTNFVKQNQGWQGQKFCREFEINVLQRDLKTIWQSFYQTKFYLSVSFWSLKGTQNYDSTENSFRATTFRKFADLYLNHRSYRK